MLLAGQMDALKKHISTLEKEGQLQTMMEFVLTLPVYDRGALILYCDQQKAKAQK